MERGEIEVSLDKMRPDEVIQNERRAMETMSETSEGTMTTSISGKSGFESRDELCDIAAVLGIGNPDDLLQERFRVDRRKLEQMLLGESSAPVYSHSILHPCPPSSIPSIFAPCPVHVFHPSFDAYVLRLRFKYIDSLFVNGIRGTVKC